MLLIYTVHVWASHVSRWLMTLIQISCLFRCFWKFTVADCKTRCCEVQTRFDKRFYLASDRDESGSHSSQKHAKALFVSWSVSMCVYIYTLYIYIHYVYIYIHNIYIHTLYIYITGFLPFMKRIRVPKLRFRPASSGLPGPPIQLRWKDLPIPGPRAGGGNDQLLMDTMGFQHNLEHLEPVAP
jgi:hypothetical protein